jgi:hypothetical protein
MSRGNSRLQAAVRHLDGLIRWMSSQGDHGDDCNRDRLAGRLIGLNDSMRTPSFVAVVELRSVVAASWAPSIAVPSRS